MWTHVKKYALTHTGELGVGASAFAVLVWSSWGGIAPLTAHPEPRTLVDGLLSGILVAGAVIAGLVGWRRYGRHVIDDALALSLGLGCVAAGHLVQLAGPSTPLDAPTQAMIGALALIQVVAAGFVLRPRVLSRSTVLLVVGTVLAVLAGFGVIAVGARATVWDAGASIALAAVGAAWVAVGWTGFQHGLDRVVARQQALDQELVDQAMLAEARAQREQLHELRSTVAGLVNGSEMLGQADISTEARLRLWESVRRELGRMQRLLSDESRPLAPIELDDALALMLDLQRLKGRQVELHTSGDTVRARYDSLAEVVNILMDNAATHGGTDSSVVAVVRRDEDTVDITVTDFGRGISDRERERIFGWGERGEDSPGEGIGLNLAQRLVAEDGGSLRLAEAEGPGSSFVISLPSPRRPVENDLTDGGSHDSWRRSG